MADTKHLLWTDAIHRTRDSRGLAGVPQSSIHVGFFFCRTRLYLEKNTWYMYLGCFFFIWGLPFILGRRGNRTNSGY